MSDKRHAKTSVFLYNGIFTLPLNPQRKDNQNGGSETGITPDQ